MALTNCPHCGKELFDMVERCNFCGGPTEIYEENEIKSAISWFKGSIIVGFITFVLVFFGFFKSYNFAGTGEIIEAIVLSVFIFYCWSASIYALYWLCKNTPILGFFAWFIIGPIYGSFVVFPKGIYRMITRKPMVYENEYMKWFRRKYR